jgi:hypothetical protein
MIRLSSVCALMLLATAIHTRAQEPHDRIAYASPPINIEFMSDPVAFDTEPVTGAPYSAEAVTDVVQTLSDGNRIVRQNKAQISRDSNGRTRREQGFAVFGPLVNGPDADARSVQISDPASGATVLLDLGSKTAHKMPAPPRILLRNKIAGINGNAAVEPAETVNVQKFEVAVPGPEARGGVMFNRVEAIAGVRAAQPAVESLGTQFMEGLAVEGTRTTVTIPARQIGNELPIHIVSERWYSPDLKVLVMSRQSDPRFGETTYRLTNVSRAEPAAELFDIPAGFKVVEPHTQMMIERKIVK